MQEIYGKQFKILGKIEGIAVKKQFNAKRTGAKARSCRKQHKRVGKRRLFTVKNESVNDTL